MLYYTAILLGLGFLLREWAGPSFADLFSLLGSILVLPALLLVASFLLGMLFLCFLWARGEQFVPALSTVIGLLLALALALLSAFDFISWQALLVPAALVLPGLIAWVRFLLLR
ncbi:hypothetical protein Dcar01_00733 [Deinococcus carri]|uniref:Uncharacterized protein n=1 Tax=Deinococcus carri TaxID=1211323 RepID=A0ABP9W3T4_9DEIO